MKTTDIALAQALIDRRKALAQYLKPPRDSYRGGNVLSEDDLPVDTVVLPRNVNSRREIPALITSHPHSSGFGVIFTPGVVEALMASARAELVEIERRLVELGIELAPADERLRASQY